MRDEIVEERVKYITTRVNEFFTDDINEYYPFFRTLARITSNYYFPITIIKKYKDIYQEKQDDKDLVITLSNILYHCKYNNLYKNEFMKIQSNIITVEKRLKEEKNAVLIIGIRDSLKREEYKLLNIPLNIKEIDTEKGVNYNNNQGFCYIKH